MDRSIRYGRSNPKRSVLMPENTALSTGISSMAAQAMGVKTENLNNEVGIKLLKESLEFEQKLTAELLKSMGIGQCVDIIV